MIRASDVSVSSLGSPDKVIILCNKLKGRLSANSSLCIQKLQSLSPLFYNRFPSYPTSSVRWSVAVNSCVFPDHVKDMCGVCIAWCGTSLTSFDIGKVRGPCAVIFLIGRRCLIVVWQGL